MQLANNLLAIIVITIGVLGALAVFIPLWVDITEQRRRDKILKGVYRE